MKLRGQSGLDSVAVLRSPSLKTAGSTTARVLVTSTTSTNVPVQLILEIQRYLIKLDLHELTDTILRVSIVRGLFHCWTKCSYCEWPLVGAVVGLCVCCRRCRLSIFQKPTASIYQYSRVSDLSKT